MSDDCWEVFNNFTDMTDMVNVYDIYGICYMPTPDPKYTYDVYTPSDTAFRKLGNTL